MPKIALITDTDSSLPIELAREYAIFLVPIIVQFGETSYRAVFDLDDAATFRRIDQDGRLPTTAAPSPGAFAEAYRSAFEAGADSVLCFTVSSEVSATYSAACSAAGMFPERVIRVIDTHSLTMGQAWMVLAAAQAISKGASIEQAIIVAEDIGGRSHLFAALATLKYLAMSGRVGQVTAGIANVLNVKPIVTIRDGRLDLLERVRTQAKAWDRTLELTAETAAGRPFEQISIVHVNAPEAATQFEARLRTALPCPKEIQHIELTPGLSVHSGSGMVGVAFVTQKGAGGSKSST